jgi:FAD/FMN-containing dehydrogenase
LPATCELRAGNASLRAGAEATLAQVQDAAAVAGQWLPVDADPAITIAALLGGRDGGPREARHGRLRDRVLACGAAGRSHGCEAVKNVAGYDMRRALLGLVPVEWAILRLAPRPAWRRHVRLTGADAVALAERLRALAAAPAALVVLTPDLLVASDDAPAGEAQRRTRDLDAEARKAGATVAELDEAQWSAICAGLPPVRVRLPGSSAAALLAGHPGSAYDAGRRLALVTAEAADAIRPARPAPAAPEALVRAVGEALGA